MIPESALILGRLNDAIALVFTARAALEYFDGDRPEWLDVGHITLALKDSTDSLMRAYHEVDGAFCTMRDSVHA